MTGGPPTTGTRGATRAGEGGGDPSQASPSPAWRLSVAVAGLMAVQSAVGVLRPSVYRDPEWVMAAWFGNDLVTLLVAVPLLLWSLVAVRRVSPRAELIWYGLLGYAVYNYAYYLFGARLNWLFPLYLAAFTTPVIALILALGRVDAGKTASRFTGRIPVRWIGGYMLFTGVGLTVAWLSQWANLMLTGTAPAVGEDAFRLVATMDLSLMVPWFVIGAVLLLRRRPWGSVIAPIVLVKGATYTLVLTTTSTVAGLRGIEGSLEQVPIWAAWTAVGGLALWGLLGAIPPQRPPP